MRAKSAEKDIVEELAGRYLSSAHCLDRPHGFLLCRVLENVVLMKVERVEDLRTARLRLLSLATDSPGHYVALNSETKQVVATVMNFNARIDEHS
jgi:hypothetical protein